VPFFFFFVVDRPTAVMRLADIRRMPLYAVFMLLLVCGVRGKAAESCVTYDN